MLSVLKDAARPILRVLGVDHYHKRHRLEAMSCLENIESEKGALDTTITTQCDQYAEEVLGNKVYAPWLYVYSALNGSFREGWIPDNFYGKVVIPRVKGKYGQLSNLNALNTVLFTDNHFPDVLSLINGKFYLPNGSPTDHRDVDRILFGDNEKVVLKLDGYNQGRGIVFFDRSNFNIEEVVRLGDGVFQSFINQHYCLGGFSESSAVSTLRVTTVIDERSLPDVRACYLRLGVGSDTHVQSKSHVRVPVSMETGALSAIGYTTKWTEITKHPDSEKRFDEVVYPNFNRVCQLVKDLHAQVPYVGSIGWDLCVDTDGAVNIIEWNGYHNDIKFSEATQGPCFKDLHWERFAQSDRRM